jgi:hypothetical protein
VLHLLHLSSIPIQVFNRAVLDDIVSGQIEVMLVHRTLELTRLSGDGSEIGNGKWICLVQAPLYC